MTYTEKYRPKILKDVVGHRQHVKYISSWSKKWETDIPKQRALILYGPAGIGKTSIAHALAHEMNWEVVELNASDTRTAIVITRIAGSASRSKSIDFSFDKKLIILDEADNLHGNSDRGGARAIVNIIKETLQPIILIANDFYKLDTALRNSCKSLQFKNINETEISKLLIYICDNENIVVDDEVISIIAKNSNGDVRAAVNELESICIGKKEVYINDIVNVDNENNKNDRNKRDTSETIFTFVDKVLKSKLSINKILELSGNIDENPESTIHWLDENIPLVYKSTNDLCKSYRLLSDADIFLGRVHKRQNYNMWKYANTLICGISTIDNNYSGFTRFSPPKYWSKLKQSKSERNIKKSIASKIGNRCHISTKKVLSEMFWFIEELMKNEEYSIMISYELDLNKDEITQLLDLKSNSKKVNTIYDILSELKEDTIELKEINTNNLVVVSNASKECETNNTQMNLDDF